tara:strand:+ start:203 stop:619 length:417 start_codon:yes stop_codon:yes gene_type:complete
MPIVRQNAVGNYIVSMATTNQQVDVTLPLPGPIVTTTTDVVVGSAANPIPLRVQGMPRLAFQFEVTAGTAANVTFIPQACIWFDLGAPDYFNLDNGTLVPVGNQALVEFTAAVEFVRVQISVPVGTTCTAFVRMMASS